MKDEPAGYLLTWATYGTWLPGDVRGWVEYRHGWQRPSPVLELEAEARMTESAVLLTAEQRTAVEAQIRETCQHRGWELHAVNCRSNHCHVVLSAVDTHPKKIRKDLKAWTTRCLKEKFDTTRQHWWGDRGSIRYLYAQRSVEDATDYVLVAQDRGGSKRR